MHSRQCRPVFQLVYFYFVSHKALFTVKYYHRQKEHHFFCYFTIWAILFVLYRSWVMNGQIIVQCAPSHIFRCCFSSFVVQHHKTTLHLMLNEWTATKSCSEATETNLEWTTVALYKCDHFVSLVFCVCFELLTQSVLLNFLCLFVRVEMSSKVHFWVCFSLYSTDRISN